MNLPTIFPHFFFVPICPEISQIFNTHINSELLITFPDRVICMNEWNTQKLPQVVVQQYNALYLYQVCCTTGMYQVPVLLLITADAMLRLLLLLLLLLLLSIAALRLKECRSTTTAYGRRTPYYLLRRPLLDCALSMHIHAPWLVVLHCSCGRIFDSIKFTSEGKPC